MSSIGMVDYGMGNLWSVQSALEWEGADVVIVDDPARLADVERIILPGVGSFGRGMENLRERGFVEGLNEAVLTQGKPIFGICLGMQLMARKSYERGEHDGLGWFDAEVLPLKPDDTKLRVPAIGWNDLDYREESPLFAGLPKRPDCYFVHSYSMRCNDVQDVEATVDYGAAVTAAVRKGNIFATQFHPEKSQEYGLRMLRNFIHWTPQAA